MKKLMALVVIATAIAAHGSVTITGHVKVGDTTAPATNVSKIRMQLMYCVQQGQNTPRVIGTGALISPQFDITPSSDGSYSKTIYANDEITCDTIGNSRWRQIMIYNNGQTSYNEYNLLFAEGPTINMDSHATSSSGATAYTPTAVLTNPAGDQTVNQPGSTFLNVNRMNCTGTCTGFSSSFSLNGLSGSSQTFATGTSGSDFGISSVGTIHTFNLPTASHSNRGLLSTSDWDTFTAKQNAIMVNTLTTLGDLLYVDATPSLARLAGNITTTRKFLTQTGSGTVSAAPAWLTIAAADIPAGTNCGANQFSNGILAALAPQCAQPAFTDISGTLGTGQLPAPIKVPNSTTLEVFNASNSETFNVYGATSSDNTTNYARLRIFYDDSAQHRATFTAEKAGTGTSPNGMDFLSPSGANYRFSDGTIRLIIGNGGITFYDGSAVAGTGVEVMRGSLSGSAQAAALATTNLYASAPAGLYRVCYYLAVSQAATTSSAAQVTVGWTDGSATAQTSVGTNLNANTVGQKDGNCISLESNGSNITLAISYASVGGTVMQYRYRATAGRSQ